MSEPSLQSLSTAVKDLIVSIVNYVLNRKYESVSEDKICNYSGLRSTSSYDEDEEILGI